MAWRRPVALASRRGRGRAAHGSHSAFPCPPLSRSGMAAHSQAETLFWRVLPSRAARSLLVHRGQRGAAYSSRNRYQMVTTAVSNLRSMACLLLLVAPKGMLADWGGSAAGPSHSATLIARDLCRRSILSLPEVLSRYYSSSPRAGVGHEAARVHHASRRLDLRLAACGARADQDDCSARRHPRWRRRWRVL